MKSLVLNKPHYAELDGELISDNHLVPKAVQEFFESNRSRNIKIVEDNGLLWLSSKLKVKRIRLSDFKKFEVCFMTRAKGPGFVAIQALPKIKSRGCVSIMDFGPYSDNALESATEMAREIDKILGYRVEVSNWGGDY